MQVYTQGIGRLLDSFSALKADGGFSIELIKSNEHSVSISVRNFDNDNIVISNSRQLLHIYPKPGGYHNFSVNIQLRFVHLSKLDITGSTSVICRDKLHSDEFIIQQSGSGIIQLNSLHTRKLIVKSLGSGTIILKGEAPETTIHLKGSGSVNTSGLLTRSLKIK